MESNSRETLYSSSLQEDVFLLLIQNVFFPRELACHKNQRDEEENFYLGILRDELASFSSQFPDIEQKCRNINKIMDNWKNIQDKSNQENIGIIVSQCRKDCLSLPFYIKEQNACLIIKFKDPKENFPATLEFFQPQIKSEPIMSQAGDLFAEFPNFAHNLASPIFLESEFFLKQLLILSYHSFQESNSNAAKKGREIEEEREVKNSTMVVDWISSMLVADCRKRIEPKIKIHKKIRDEVLFQQGHHTLRRSGLWTCCKVFLHLIMSETFGIERGGFMYKSLMCQTMCALLDASFYYKENENNNIYEAKYYVIKDSVMSHCKAKLARRIKKLEVFYNLKKTSLERSDSKIFGFVLDFGKIIFEKIERYYFYRPKIQRDPEPYFDKEVIKIATDHQTSLSHLRTNISGYAVLPVVGATGDKEDNQNSEISRNKPNEEEIDLKYFNDKMGVVRKNALLDLEKWLELRVDSINFPSEQMQSSEFVFNLLDTYLEKANTIYERNPVAQGRMVLAIINLILRLDSIATAEYPLLKDHQLGITTEIFESLLAPRLDDLAYVRKLAELIEVRNKGKTYPSLIDLKKQNEQSFSLRLAKLGDEYYNKIEKIQNIAEKKKILIENKLDETKMIYDDLIFQYNRMDCQLTEYFNRKTNITKWEHNEKFCIKCQTYKRANSLKVPIFEEPLPEKENEKLLVVFELMIPKAIAHLRDALFLFHSTYRLKSDEKNIKKSKGIWAEFKNLEGMALKSQPKYVKLCTSSKPFHQTHYYGAKIVNNSHSKFFLPNGCNLCYTDTRSNNIFNGFEKQKWNQNRFSFSIPNNSIYSCLEFALKQTTHTENEVIAAQYMCPNSLNLLEYIKFGCLRAGHILQLRNLLESLEAQCLSFEKSEVFWLISQTLYEVGPLRKITSSPETYMESHWDMYQAEYVERLLLVLADLLKLHKDNWKDSNIYVLLTVIMMRLYAFSFNYGEDFRLKVSQEIKNIRATLNMWEQKIEVDVKKLAGKRNRMDELKLKLVEIAATRALTYFIPNMEKFKTVEEEDIFQWLSCMRRVYENSSFEEEDEEFSQMKSLFNYLKEEIRLCELHMEEVFESIIERTKYSCLDRFVRSCWPAARSGSFEDWTKKEGLVRNYFVSKFVSPEKKIQTIKVGLDGSLLVEGKILRKLPENISTHTHFKLIFEDSVFEARPGQKPNSYCVKLSDLLSYEFFISTDNLLQIKEYRKDISHSEEVECLFIPREKFSKNQEAYLPKLLTESYSHWFLPSRRRILFRPKKFRDPNFSSVYYQYFLQNGQLKREEDEMILLDIHSSVFRSLYFSCFKRIENQEYVHVWLSEASPLDLHINLPRMSLNFIYKYDPKSMEPKIESVEYDQMNIDFKSQNIRTLNGMSQGLVLISGGSIKKTFILFPHGRIELVSQGGARFQNVYINIGDELRNPPHFCYEVDYKFKTLKSDTTAGWIFLAALHASTSSCYPDELTGVTGMEMAMNLLQSASCWSCQPFEEEALKTLNFISRLSPLREFYPPDRKIMQKVTWSEQLVPFNNHDGYYLVVSYLLFMSERLKYAYPKTGRPKSDPIKKTSIELLLRAYWRYEQFIPPLARLKKEVIDILNFSLGGGKASRPSSVFYDLRPNPLKGKDDEIRLLSWIMINEAPLKTSKNEFLTNDLIGEDGLNGKRVEGLELKDCKGWSIYEDINSEIWIDLFFLARDSCEPEDRMKLFLFLSWAVFTDRLPVDRAKLLLTVMFKNNEFSSLHLDSVSVYVEPFNVYLNTVGTLKTIESLANYTFSYNGNLGFNEQYKIKLAVKKEIESESEFLLELMNESIDLGVEFDPDPKLFNYFNEESLQKLSLIVKSKIDNKQLGKFMTSFQKIYNNISFQFNEKDSRFAVYDATLGKLVDFPKTKPSVSFGGEPEKIVPKNKKFQSLIAKASSIYKSGKIDDLPVFKEIEDTLNLEKKNSYNIDSKSMPNLVLKNMISVNLDILVSQRTPFPLSEADEKSVISKEMIQELKASWNKHIDRKETIKKYKFLKTKALDAKKQLEQLEESLNDAIKEHFVPEDPVNQLMEKAGILRRFVPKNFIDVLLIQNDLNSKDLENLVGSLCVVWSFHQKICRCLNYFSMEEQLQYALERELSYEGHDNWSPQEYPEWLLIELGLEIMIRPEQIETTQKMMKPENGMNTVMQLNMGEGKTSVIVPLLCAKLTEKNKLVQVTVLKSLFNMNYNYLSSKLGMILDRRVFVFPFKRDLELKENDIDNLKMMMDICMKTKGIILTIPEYRLSFNLKGLELCLLNQLHLGSKFLTIKSWIDKNTRDIIDECDEVLSVKYQLIYTVGKQEKIQELRWKVIEGIFNFGRKYFRLIAEKYGQNCVEYKDRTGSDIEYCFPHIRLLNKEPYKELCELILDDILSGRTMPYFEFQDLVEDERKIVKSYILDDKISTYEQTLKILKKKEDYINVVYILRGVFAHEILYLALSKRWKVNYGTRHERDAYMLQAVPYRAKDVPAERAQFGHPDVAIILTVLSYYYSGLNDKQLEQVFEKLESIKSTSERDGIYDRWVEKLPKKTGVITSIKSYRGINLSDVDQKYNHLFPVLRMHPDVINYWMNNILFIKESKDFNRKLGTSAWDLCPNKTQNFLMTGFSGTTDSKILLPSNVTFYDNPKLAHTNGLVLSNIIKQNEYEELKPYTTGRDILKKIIDSKIPIRLLIDVGALMVELKNEQVAREWLIMSKKDIEAAVYFDQDNNLMVLDRQGKKVPFQYSTFKFQLGRCVIYLDDVHTRGTDLRIPVGTFGVVTLGKGLSKDRILQACMRMRLLGRGHSVCFWAALEVHNKIKEMKEKRGDTGLGNINSRDVIEWALSNTKESIAEGFVYWAAQGLSYHRKRAAFKRFDKDLTDYSALEKLAQCCLDFDEKTLKRMYGIDRMARLVTTVLEVKIKMIRNHLSYHKVDEKFFTEKSNEIQKRIEYFVSKEEIFSHAFEEEQELELEIEIELEEEREIEKPPKMIPSEPYFEKDVEKLLRNKQIIYRSKHYSPISESVYFTDFHPIFQAQAWDKNILTTRDYKEVLKQSLSQELNQFLRPPKWVAEIEIEGEKHYIILSAFEANSYLKKYPLEIYTIKMIVFRTNLNQKNSFFFPQMFTKKEIFSQLFIYSGSMFLRNIKEQSCLLEYLGLYISPRTPEEEKLFNMKIIDEFGFIPVEERGRARLNFPKYVPSRFEEDPGELICILCDLRNYAHGKTPDNAHYLQILIERVKPFTTNNEQTTIIY